MQTPGTSLQRHDEGYALFRRAIVERDGSAWAEIHARYRTLLIAWARQSSVAELAGDPYEDIADQALARAWSALTPARFDEFPGLAALLAYLRTCVVAVQIDAGRAQASRERALKKLEVGQLATPEQIVVDELSSAEVWRLVSSLVETPQERVVLVESFVYARPPRAIFARHPTLFRDIDAVYSAKRNLLARLQRNPELRRLWDESGT